jgi:death-on-curing protein
MAAVTLTPEDVLQIHEVLVADFAQASDPISPPGVRDLGLLESAVARQHVSFGSIEKYRSPIERAATLT